jgi:hypothetical protein
LNICFTKNCQPCLLPYMSLKGVGVICLHNFETILEPRKRDYFNLIFCGQINVYQEKTDLELSCFTKVGITTFTPFYDTIGSRHCQQTD